ncbi:MAG: winged helix-turn-helix transcriptional regulator [Rhizobiales bacterium]|nr:winged helix-turn-helix transcriptional regulator [Hyphomicrobiales bacterium]
MNNHILQIQKLFPRIYMACHVEHNKRRTITDQISTRDAAILAHLDQKHFQSPKTLAKHLNIAASTMSEALHHLVSLGFVDFKSDEIDARHTLFSLTNKGEAAISTNSVLDQKKLSNLLENMPLVDQEKAVLGLKLLADAATKM